jgi:DNA-binding winged helix-turn-helix (wHTH) protein
VEDLEVDPATRRVTRAGRDIRLSSKEFNLLHLLMRHAGTQVTRQELLTDVWGAQPDSDSNLVDVYVNYLRRKIENFVDVRGEERIDEEKKLIHTVRGIGYRIGREALVPKGAADAAQSNQEALRATKNVGQPGAAFAGGEQGTLQQMAWRALINSLAHDLAQPLTNVRCFLEMTAMRKGNLSMAPTDLRNAEHQADRAIALEKTIAALVREVSVPSGPWTALNSLLEQVFENFNVLVQSGLLTLERRWDLSLQVTSNPVLLQLLVLLIGKLAGKNTVPITLTVTASRRDGRCHLELRWRPTEQGEVQEAETALGHDLPHVREMAYSIGADLAFERPSGICLKLPTTQQASTPPPLQHSAVH